MARFPISSRHIANQEATIKGSDYRHIVKVLRLKPGDKLVLFDESSFEHVGKIAEINKTEIRVEILSSAKANAESDTKITLLQGIPKGSKMDFIIEKATELGVSSIVPVVTERSQVRQTNKAMRWQRIATESSKQCGRVTVPKIHDFVGFDQTKFYSRDSDLRLICHQDSETNLIHYINTTPQPTMTISIFIGPEGGFSEPEIELAKEMGFSPVGLGPRILRTETAAIVVIALIQHILGDI